MEVKIRSDRGLVASAAPAIGCIAFCAKGRLGLITRSRTNTEGQVTWIGITIAGTSVGRDWSSTKPCVVGFVTEDGIHAITEFIDSLRIVEFGN